MSTIKASNGKVLVRPGGNVLATTCGAPAFNCSSPAINGCATCSCCGSNRYLVCISGATGDNAVINSNTSGWTLYNGGSGGSGGSYVFDNGSVRLTLDLSTYTDPTYGMQGRCRDWQLKAYRNSGGSWVECLSASGGAAAWTNLDNNCRKSGTVSGITYSIKPAENWFPTQMRLAISGHVPCTTTCNASTYNNFYYKVNSVSLDGIYVVPLTDVSQYNDCSYRLSGVGAYSYSTWSTSGCSGPPAKTITGRFNILVYLSGAQVRVRVTQSISDAISPGDEFNAFKDMSTDPCNCKTFNIGGLVSYDNRCAAWGYWNTSWVRCGKDSTATVVALP